MPLPVDIGAVISAAFDTDKARQTPLSLSIYMDDSAPSDLQAHVRQNFSSDAPEARVAISYLDGRPFSVSEDDDLAIIVAGEDYQVGRYAQQVRNAGVPVMVVTTQPATVGEAAKAQGCPIPQGDLIAPATPSLKITSAQQDKPLASLMVTSVSDEESEAEPVLFDKAAASSLDQRMGRWIIEACKHKRLAYAYAFPFVRRPLSLESVSTTSLQNAAVGALLFLPGADLPVMTLNQAKMILEIAAVYGEKINISRAKELAAVVGGAFACRAVARELASIVPVLGWAIKAAVGYSGTVAMGRAAIRYYEDGAKLTSLTNVLASARDKAVQAAAGQAGNMVRNAGAQIFTGIRDTIFQAAGLVHDVATGRSNQSDTD